MKQFRLLLNTTPLLLQRTGIGNYIGALAHALKSHADISVTYIVNGKQYGKFEIQTEQKNFFSGLKKTLKTLGADSDFLRKMYFMAREKRLQLSGANSFQNNQIYHETHYYPFRLNIPTVTTVYDLSMLLYPELHEICKIREFNRLSARIFRYSDRIHAISQAVKDEILKYSNFEEARIDIIPPMIDPAFRKLPGEETKNFLAAKQIDSKYILYTGTLEPRKNLPNLLKAFELLRRKYKWPGILVIAGATGWNFSEIYRTTEKLNLSGHVKFAGYTPFNELPYLYNGADAFVYPSVYEGFGMPCLESLRCGTPVSASRIPSLIESTSGMATYFNPSDPDDMARNILQTLEKKDSNKIHMDSAFNETHIISNLLQSYEKLLSAGRRAQ